MSSVSPVVSRATTWKAWVGFDVNHRFGAILFKVVYGYLVVAHPAVWFESVFLLVVGIVMLSGYAFLGQAFLTCRVTTGVAPGPVK